MFKTFQRLLPIFAILVLAGCTESTEQPPNTSTDAGMTEEDAGDTGETADMSSGDPVVVQVVIEPETPVVAVGDSLQFTATPFDADGNAIETGAGDPQWTSSDPTVAPISSGGRVVAARIGKTDISATFQDVTATIELTVADVQVDTVEVLPPRVVFTIGDSFEFIANPRDAAGDPIDSGLDVTWRLEDTSIATLDGSTVTATSAGTTQLIATVQGVEGSAEIVVEDAVLDGVTIDQLDQTLVPGDSAALTTSFTWQDAEPSNLPTVAWSSSDPSVTVDGSGEITAISPGSATITASVGSLSDAIEVTVIGAFDEMAVGDSHTCGRIREAVYCWGANDSGQLGHSATGIGRVTGIPAAKEIDVGRAHTCIRATNDDVYCWGANDSGQLGTGNTNPQTAPVAVPMAGTGELIVERDMVCAGGACWGDFITTSSFSPSMVLERRFPGVDHICSIDLSGSTRCQGANDQGQLGINSTSAMDSGTPVGGYDFSVLSLGDAFTCGRVVGGGIACWGDGELGQIGDGDFADVQVPILTPLLVTPTTLTTGDTHACTVTAGGNAWCWGGNASGQVGNGTTLDVGTPTEVTSSKVFVDIDAAGDRTCALSNDGEVWCWGGSDGSSPTLFVPGW